MAAPTEVHYISNAAQNRRLCRVHVRIPNHRGNRVENRGTETLDAQTNQGNRNMQMTNVATVALNTQRQKHVKLRANSAISVINGTILKSCVGLKSLFMRFLKGIMSHKCKTVIRMISLWIVWRVINF